MFEIADEHKISLEGFMEQPLPYQCPVCKTEMKSINMVGFGTFPKGGYYATLKPNKTIGVGFCCPKCDAKSTFQADKFEYILYLDTLEILKLKK
jgi:rubredoxin